MREVVELPDRQRTAEASRRACRLLEAALAPCADDVRSVGLRAHADRGRPARLAAVAVLSSGRLIVLVAEEELSEAGLGRFIRRFRWSVARQLRVDVQTWREH